MLHIVILNLYQNDMASMTERQEIWRVEGESNS